MTVVWHVQLPSILKEKFTEVADEKVIVLNYIFHWINTEKPATNMKITSSRTTIKSMKHIKSCTEQLY
jgi:hypothetical protein